MIMKREMWKGSEACKAREQKSTTKRYDRIQLVICNCNRNFISKGMSNLLLISIYQTEKAVHLQAWFIFSFVEQGFPPEGLIIFLITYCCLLHL